MTSIKFLFSTTKVRLTQETLYLYGLMLDQILHWDQEVFYLINGSQLPLLDGLMPFFRHKLFWLPLYVFLLAFILFNLRHAWWIIVALVATVAISDVVSSQLVKKNVQRVRPCNDEAIEAKVLLRVRCGGGYSFTSSHATNHAAVGFFFFFLFQNFSRRYRLLLPIWAVLISLAQVYVGVHYPGDVLAGYLLGAIIGTLMYKLFRIIIPED